ncbi:MAG: hypothetical protein RL653_4080 [Pseudomonadota bacterium]|jgi:hypothetical protein
MVRWICVVGTLVSLPVLAQEKKGGEPGNVRYSKTTSYDFEDDTIEGDLTKPDGEYVEARKKVQHSNLIRVREDFKEEVMQSVGEL